MLPVKQGKAFRDFYDAARDSDLDAKTTTLVGLAAALTAACDP